MIISLSQPKKPDKAITMKHLRVFFFALLLLASPLLQGNIIVSSSHFIDPDPDLHALAKRILFCSWTLSLFFFLIWNSCVVYQFFLSCQSIELRSIWFGYLEILLCFCHSSSLLIYWLTRCFFLYVLIFFSKWNLTWCFALLIKKSIFQMLIGDRISSCNIFMLDNNTEVLLELYWNEFLLFIGF